MGKKLSLRTALYRTLGVFVHGMGGGIPFYDLYRSFQCYRDCTVEELPWDLDNACAIVVRERETKWYRIAGYLVLTVLTALADEGIVLRAELPPPSGRADACGICGQLQRLSGISKLSTLCGSRRHMAGSADIWKMV